MANWTVATTLERLGQILQEENLIDFDILDVDKKGAGENDVTLFEIVECMKERIVRDQFTPKAKATARAKKAASDTPNEGT